MTSADYVLTLREIWDFLVGFKDEAQAGFGRLEGEISILKTDVTVLKDNVAGLKSDVRVLKADVAGIRNHIVRIDRRLIKLDDGVSLIESRA